MHPTISYRLAQARVADLRQHVRRDALARTARRARPDRRGPFSPTRHTATTDLRSEN